MIVVFTRVKIYNLHGLQGMPKVGSDALEMGSKFLCTVGVIRPIKASEMHRKYRTVLLLSISSFGC